MRPPTRRTVRPAPPSLVVAALALALAGCATSSPPPRFGVEPPPEWSARPLPEEPAGETAVHAADGAWWRRWPEPVPSLVEEALAGNLDLAAAAARLEASEAQARIAGADRWPQIAAGADGFRQRQNFIGLPIPGSQGGVLSSTSTTLGVSLNVSWEVDLWGRIRDATRAAAADYRAAEADLAAARLSLAAQATKAVSALAEAELQVELAEEVLANRESSLARIERRYRAGLRPPLDRRLAETDRQLAVAAVAASQRRLDAVRRQLELLLGRYPAAAVRVPPALPAPPRPIPAGLPAELLERRPDLQAAALRVAAAAARIGEARAARLPRLSLTGSAGRRSQELEDLLDNDFSVWSLASNLLAPLLQGGRLAAAEAAAAALYRGEAAGYAQRALAAFAEVETALAAEERIALEVAALEGAAKSAQAALSLAEQQYLSGLVDYLTVLTAQRQELEARRSLLDARRRLLDARVDLHLALGGDFARDDDPDPGASVPAA